MIISFILILHSTSKFQRIKVFSFAFVVNQTQDFWKETRFWIIFETFALFSMTKFSFIQIWKLLKAMDINTWNYSIYRENCKISIEPLCSFILSYCVYMWDVFECLHCLPLFNQSLRLVFLLWFCSNMNLLEKYLFCELNQIWFKILFSYKYFVILFLKLLFWGDLCLFIKPIW